MSHDHGTTIQSKGTTLVLVHTVDIVFIYSTRPAITEVISCQKKIESKSCDQTREITK